VNQKLFEKIIGDFDVAKQARRAARNRAQKAPATRKIEDKRRKPEKHKKREAGL